MKNILSMTGVALVLCICLTSSTGEAKKQKAAAAPRFSRAELVVINLDHGSKSAGYYIVLAARQNRESLKSLDKALRQIEQADRELAKFKGKPDNHYLTASLNRLKSAQANAQALEEQLSGAHAELRETIKDSLVAN